MVAICCLLPIGALLFCEVWSILFYFEESTATGCGRRKAWNFVPSISEAIGHRAPQKYIWQACIALHWTPRLLIAFGYYSMYANRFSQPASLAKFTWLSKISFVLHITEICALVGLSFVSSTDDHQSHENFFIVFIVCSMINMLVVCTIHGLGFSSTSKLESKTLEEKSYYLKRNLAFINILVFAVSMYFYHRHNTLCEDGVYSVFALCEVVVVATNIAFHGTAILDFKSFQIVMQNVNLQMEKTE